MPIRPDGTRLSTTAARVLDVLCAGGSIAARRTYPHPYKHALVRPDRMVYAGTISPAVIQQLVGDAYIEGEPAPQYGEDAISYRVTDAGRRGFALDYLEADDTQLAMFSEQATTTRARTRDAMRGAA